MKLFDNEVMFMKGVQRVSLILFLRSHSLTVVFKFNIVFRDLLIFILKCLDSVLICMSMYHVHVWCQQMPGESTRFSGTGVMKSCDAM